MKLYKIHTVNNAEKADLILTQLSVADQFFSRLKGLLGKQHLPADQALWIKPCNNIHTFFMKFAIDCVFVNKKNKIEKIYSNIKPYRIIGPVWKAVSVFEFSAGTAEKNNLKIGDQLHVVS